LYIHATTAFADKPVDIPIFGVGVGVGIYQGFEDMAKLLSFVAVFAS